jgi:3-oxoacyl-[acyl-carrier protein] reductase
MMFDLTGKTTLITGATGGMGEAIAEALHRGGATIAISGTRLAALEALAKKLGNRVHILPCNLSEKLQARILVPQAEKAMGGLDVLIANAGIIRASQPIAQQRDDDWAAVLQLNLIATMQLVQAAICGMTERGFGRLIAITPVLGTTGLAGQAHYAAAKAGAVAMIKSFARECAEHGVTANCVARGFLEIPMAGMLRRFPKSQKCPRYHGRHSGWRGIPAAKRQCYRSCYCRKRIFRPQSRISS